MYFLTSTLFVIYLSIAASSFAHPEKKEEFTYTNHKARKITLRTYIKNLKDIDSDLDNQLDIEEISTYLDTHIPQHLKSIKRNLRQTYKRLDSITKSEKQAERYKYIELKEEIVKFFEPRIKELEKEQENILEKLYKLKNDTDHNIQIQSKKILLDSSHQTQQLTNTAEHYSNLSKDRKLLKKTQNLHKTGKPIPEPCKESNLNNQWTEDLVKKHDPEEYFLATTLPEKRKSITAMLSSAIQAIDYKIKMEEKTNNQKEIEHLVDLKNEIIQLTTETLDTTGEAAIRNKINKISIDTGKDQERKHEDINKIIEGSTEKLNSQENKLGWYENDINSTSKLDITKNNYAPPANRLSKFNLSSIFIMCITGEKTPKNIHESALNIWRISTSRLNLSL